MPGAIYESKDAAATWTIIDESKHFGTCRSFKNPVSKNQDSPKMNGIEVLGAVIGLAKRASYMWERRPSGLLIVEIMV